MTTSDSVSSAVLWTHDSSQYNDVAVFNPQLLKTVHDGSLHELVLRQQGNGSAQSAAHCENKDKEESSRIFVTLKALTPEQLGKNQKLQLSVSSHFAGALDIVSRSDVALRQVRDASEAAASHILLFFRDQYISRSDMWRLSCSLSGKCVYIGQRITFLGSIRAEIGAVWRRDRQVDSAYISATTKPVFRSESGRLLIFIQMSREMWHFEEDGELLYNKAVDSFLPSLFKIWKAHGAHHLVTIALFTRVVYDDSGAVGIRESREPNNSVTEKDGLVTSQGMTENTFYRDFFKVVVDNSSSRAFESTLLNLKRELAKFQKDVLLFDGKNSTDNPSKPKMISGKMTHAKDGNVLESINLAIYQFQKDYVDRDLLRTGTSIILVTPGTGLFDVDEALLRKTSEALITCSITIDIVCLSRRPLHAVPLFRYKGKSSNVPLDVLGSSPDNPKRRRPSASFHSPSQTSSLASLNYLMRQHYANQLWNLALPSFLEIHYFASIEQERHVDDLRRGFETTCRMHELQMMGFMENEISEISIPYLHKPSGKAEEDWFDDYDAQVFSFRPTLKKARNAIRDQVGSGVNEGQDNSELAVVDEDVNPHERVSTGERRSNTSLPGLTRAADGQRNISLPTLPDESPPAKDLRSVKSTNFKTPSFKGFNVGPVRPTAGVTKSFAEIFSSGALSQNSETGLETVQSSATRPRTPSIRKEHFEAAAPRPSVVSGSSNTRQSKPLNIANKKKNPPAPKQSDENEPSWRLLNSLSSDITRVSEEDKHARRWKHLFVRWPPADYAFSWENMRAPASLPITTEYDPSIELLQNEFSEYTYTVAVDNEETSFSPKELMNEMVALRLNQYFQIVIKDPDSSKSDGGTDGFIQSTSFRSTLPEGALGDTGDRIYLCLSDFEIHRLTWDPMGYNIEVKRYVRNRKISNPIPYQCFVWQAAQKGYTRQDLYLGPPNAVGQSWNYIDQLIAGYEQKLNSTVKYWRARFVVIPKSASSNTHKVNATNHILDELDDEELKLAGIYKLCNLIERNQFRSKKETHLPPKRDEMNVLGLKFTTLRLSDFVTNELLNLESDANNTDKRPLMLQISDRFSRSSFSYSTVASELQGPNGIKLCDRRWHFRTYENCFLGSDLVTWLLQNFIDVRTREDGVAFGNELKVHGVFEHVEKRHKFLDGHYFYYLRTGRQRGSSKSWFHKKVDPIKEGKKLEWPKARAPGQPHVSPKVELSRTVFLDVDPQKQSYRPEFTTLHYDVVHNPEHCYHIRLEWIGVTARLIEDTLRTWSRVLDRHELRLAEVPIDECSRIQEFTPLRHCLLIDLVLEPPPVPPEAALSEGERVFNKDFFWWQKQILRRCDFVLDLESKDDFPSGAQVQYSWGKLDYRYSQYIHRSGVSLVQIDNNGVFNWLTNRLHASRVFGVATGGRLSGPSNTSTGDAYDTPRCEESRDSNDASQATPNKDPVKQARRDAFDPDSLREEFVAFCSSKERLQQFYDETIQILGANARMMIPETRRGSADDSMTYPPSPSSSIAGSQSSAPFSPLRVPEDSLYDTYRPIRRTKRSLSLESHGRSKGSSILSPTQKPDDKQNNIEDLTI